MKKTVILTKNGDPEGVTNLDQDQLTKLQGKTFHSGSDKIGIVNTGIVGEEMQQADFSSIAKQLGKSVVTALRDHGDEVAFASAKHVGPEGCTIHIQYKPDDQGETWEDDFQFSFSNDGKVSLGGGNTVCQLQQLSGEARIQKDLVKDAILSYIEGKTNPTDVEDAPEQTNLKEEERQRDLLLGFKQAVKEFQENPSDREKIKDLFRQSRGFEGDSLAQKFKNAVETYKAAIPVEEPNVPDGLETPADSEPEELTVGTINTTEEQPECTSGGFICMNISLLLRLLEYAKEEAKEDIDLHFISEKAQELSKEGRGLTVADYDTLISKSTESDEQEEEPNSEKEPEEVEENWFDPSDDEIEDMRNSAHDYQDYPQGKDEVDEVSSDFLAKASDAAAIKGRPKQQSKFSSEADKRREQELGMDNILSMYVQAKRGKCTVSDSNRYLSVDKVGQVRNAEKNVIYGSNEQTHVKWPLEQKVKLSGNRAKQLAKIMAKWCSRFMDDIPEKESYTDWHNWVAL